MAAIRTHRQATRRGAAPLAGSASAAYLRAGVRVLFPVLLLGLAAGAATAQTAAGTAIVNSATATYGAGGQDTLSVESNAVTLTVVVARTPADLGFLRLAGPDPLSDDLDLGGTGYSTSGTELGPFDPLPGPTTPSGDPIDLGAVDLAPEQTFRQNEPVFLLLADPDQNLDPGAPENVLVVVTAAATGEREWLRLQETGPDTGLFGGFVQAAGGSVATVGDGVLTVMAGCEVLARYQDPVAPADQATARALIDPLGTVFDAITGAPVDGAGVTLIDATTGLPATVLGDDGVSAFPSTVVSGGQTADAGGALYDPPPGGFRFPLVEPGRYRLRVDPPPGYTAPSEVATAALQLLPGAPWALDEAGSRGEPFTVTEGPPLQLDLPVDPAGGALFLAKSAGKSVTAVGEWVPWELRLTNTDDDDAGAITLDDQLPRGFRYEPGSLRIDGASAPDPRLAADGLALTVDLPGLAAGASVSVRYVTAVLAHAPSGRAGGAARAAHAGLSSNRAEASVLVEDDIFAERSRLMGRVLVADCAADAPDSTVGVPGVRLYLEDGTSVVTDPLGRYHLENVRPGAHVLQLDTTTLPPRYAAGDCEVSSRRALHPFSRMIDLQAGTLWRIDFPVHPVAPDTGQVSLDLAVLLEKDRLEGTVTMANGEVPVRNLRLTVLLPDGTRYVPGSTTLEGAAWADPEDRGGVLVWRLGDVPAGWTGDIGYTATVTAGDAGLARRADLETGALLVVDTPGRANLRTPPVRTVVALIPEQSRVRNPEIVLRPRFASLQAELNAADAAAIDSLAARIARKTVLGVRVVGHTDSQGIPARHRDRFADNHALGLARAQAVADRLALTLDLGEDQLHVFSRGAEEPVADNSGAEGRALNRRVVVHAWTEDVVHHLPSHPVRDRATAAAPVVGLRPGERWPGEVTAEVDPDAMPVFDMGWLERAEPGFALVWPPAGHLPAIPSLKAAVKHDPAVRVRLLVNGLPADQINFDGTANNSAGTLAVTRWAGIDLREGDNLLQVAAIDREGREVATAERLVHYSGPPVKIELVPELSELVAGGQRAAVITVRLTDADGFPARRGVVGEYAVDAPYEPERIRTEEERAALGTLEERTPRYEVGPDGLARIRLEPTTRTGEVHLRFPLSRRTEEIRAWLEPEPRDWILVGLAEGTVGWNAVSGNVENLDAVEEDFHADGRLAFFARGRVKGKWLLTAAYDSRAKGDSPADRAVDGAIDPEAFFTVYGDASVQGQDAATTGKLYVKLERRQFFALFGDFATGLTVSELGRYNRRLNGLQAGFRNEHLDLSAFASRSEHAYGHDEIRGDGTSGIYRLSRQDILVGSETVRIQVRDRYRSEVVLSERRLSRVVDYDIDYLRGELVFKEPVFARDENFNPVWIVAEYETWHDEDPDLTGGGRAAVHAAGDRIEAGVTMIHEGGDGTGGDLAAVDGRWDITDALRLKAELAGSDNDLAGRRGAWLAELTNRSRRLDARAWIRRQEEGFGLGQQQRGEAGMFKAGVAADWRFAPSWTLGGQLSHRQNLVTEAEQDLAEARLAWQRGSLGADLGYRQAGDRFIDSADRRSRQLRAGASVGVLANRLRLRAGHEQNLDEGGEGRVGASADYPTRTNLGVDWQMTSEVILFGTGELTHDEQETRSTRLGLRTVPWAGAEATSSVEERHREGAVRVFQNVGLKQTWRINERWSLDGGVDHAKVSGEAPPQVNPAVPSSGGPATGYTALSLGWSLRGASWRWTQRGEVRGADDEDKWAVDGGLFVEPSRSVGLQARLRLDRSDGASGRLHRSVAGLGWAWRPDPSPWTLLQRLDYKVDDNRTAGLDLQSRRVVQYLNLVWRQLEWLQLAGRYGARYAFETIDGDRYKGYTDVAGLEGRWFFARRWDAALQASTRNSWAHDVHDLSLGISGGVRLVEDLWLSLGYNLWGYRDRDFSAGEATAQGPYLRLRFRFNQESSRETLR